MTHLLLPILLSLFFTPTIANASLLLTIPLSTHLPSPSTLPPSTHATLTTINLTLTAPLRRTSTFLFAAIPAGSYLCEVYARDFAFAPLRVDVSEGVDGKDGKVEVWQTFRGNEWENKGERIGSGEGEVRVEVRVLGERGFYEARGGFSPFDFLKNPMILIAIVSMGAMFGMPYLIDNMDPEMKKEFEESQKGNSLAKVAANPMQGFDIASYMAGSGSGSAAKNAGVEVDTPKSSGADEKKGAKARRRG